MRVGFKVGVLVGFEVGREVGSRVGRIALDVGIRVGILIFLRVGRGVDMMMGELETGLVDDKVGMIVGWRDISEPLLSIVEFVLSIGPIFKSLGLPLICSNLDSEATKGKRKYATMYRFIVIMNFYGKL